MGMLIKGVKTKYYYNGFDYTKVKPIPDLATIENESD
jgi:hypothetical protein